MFALSDTSCGSRRTPYIPSDESRGFTAFLVSEIHEIRPQTDVVLTGHIDQVARVPGYIQPRRVLAHEPWVEVNTNDAATLGNRPYQLVRQVTHVIAKGPGIAVRGDYGILTHVEHIADARKSQVRHVNRHAQAVHFLHHLRAEAAETTGAWPFANTGGHSIPVIPRQTDQANAEPPECPQKGDIVVERLRSLESEHDREDAPAPRLLQVRMTRDDSEPAAGLVYVVQYLVQRV